MDINNSKDIEAILEAKAREALKEATEEILDRFKNEYLLKYVYAGSDSHPANEAYHDGSGQPTFEFLEAWDWSTIRRMTNSLVTEMYYSAGKLDFDMDTYKHGSKYSRPADVRAALPDILNKVGYSSSLWLSVYRPVAYWTKFIEDLFDRGELEKILNRHFQAQGFTKI